MSDKKEKSKDAFVSLLTEGVSVESFVYEYFIRRKNPDLLNNLSYAERLVLVRDLLREAEDQKDNDDETNSDKEAFDDCNESDDSVDHTEEDFREHENQQIVVDHGHEVEDFATWPILVCGSSQDLALLSRDHDEEGSDDRRQQSASRVEIMFENLSSGSESSPSISSEEETLSDGSFDQDGFDDTVLLCQGGLALEEGSLRAYSRYENSSESSGNSHDQDLWSSDDESGLYRFDSRLQMI